MNEKEAFIASNFMPTIQLKPISQQVVAVVGASSGIGRATALEFAKHGAKVSVSARSPAKLASLVDEIKSLGGDAIAITADVADFEQVRAIADQTVAHYGRLDTWVHSAATGIVAPFEQTTPAEFKRVIEVNLLGQVYGAMAALPHLRREGRGALIHISSVEAHRSLPLQSAYASSKHGIEGFLDSLRVELQHDDVPISVTNVMPATINTPFYNNALTKIGVKPTGVPPYYQPELVAEAIVHAAQHPMRDMVVGDAGIALDVMQKVLPQVADTALQAIAVNGQHTQTPKSATDPHNLYAPVESEDRVRGDYDHLVIPSVLDRLTRLPQTAWGAIAGASVLALLATQVLTNRKSF